MRSTLEHPFAHQDSHPHQPPLPHSTAATAPTQHPGTSPLPPPRTRTPVRHSSPSATRSPTASRHPSPSLPRRPLHQNRTNVPTPPCPLAVSGREPKASMVCSRVRKFPEKAKSLCVLLSFYSFDQFCCTGSIAAPALGLCCGFPHILSTISQLIRVSASFLRFLQFFACFFPTVGV